MNVSLKPSDMAGKSMNKAESLQKATRPDLANVPSSNVITCMPLRFRLQMPWKPGQLITTVTGQLLVSTTENQTAVSNDQVTQFPNAAVAMINLTFCTIPLTRISSVAPTEPSKNHVKIMAANR